MKKIVIIVAAAIIIICCFFLIGSCAKENANKKNNQVENNSTTQETNPTNQDDNNPGNQDDNNPGNQDDNNPGNQDDNNPGNQDDNNPGNQGETDPVNKNVKAVWWWNDNLTDDHLTFANTNGINTIYYCTDKFNEETASFVQKANNLNMDVYLLAGEKEWVKDNTGLNSIISKYEEYQNTYSSSKFKGVHLDIEPHVLPEFNDESRNGLFLSLINIAKTLSQKDYPVEYDIPFWLDDMIEIDGVSKEAYKWLIDYSDGINVMSYRDSKESILNIAKEEYEYAASVNKGIIISFETYSTEGDNVSFAEEGRNYMNGIINEIYNSEIPGVKGVSIHHMKAWYEMKD